MSIVSNQDTRVQEAEASIQGMRERLESMYVPQEDFKELVINIVNAVNENTREINGIQRNLAALSLSVDENATEERLLQTEQMISRMQGQLSQIGGISHDRAESARVLQVERDLAEIQAQLRETGNNRELQRGAGNGTLVATDIAGGRPLTMDKFKEFFNAFDKAVQDVSTDVRKVMEAFTKLSARVDEIQVKANAVEHCINFEDFQEFAVALKKQVAKIDGNTKKQLECKAGSEQLRLAERTIAEMQQQLRRLITDLSDLEVVHDS